LSAIQGICVVINLLQPEDFQLTEGTDKSYE